MRTLWPCPLEVSNVAQRRFVWQVWHLNMFHHVSKVVLCDRCGDTFAFQKFRCMFPGRRSTLDVSCSMVFANRIGRAASSCDNVQIPWPAWDIVRVPLCVAGAVFIGEDPSCVECFFCMIGSAAFRIGTAARGAMLPSSFVPCRMAGAILGDVVTCHSRLDPPHSTAHTFHYHSDHMWHSTPHSTFRARVHAWHFTLNTPHCTLCTPLFTLHTLHFTLHTLHLTPNTRTLHFLHSTLCALRFILYTSHSTLYTLLFTPQHFAL